MARIMVSQGPFVQRSCRVSRPNAPLPSPFRRRRRRKGEGRGGFFEASSLACLSPFRRRGAGGESLDCPSTRRHADQWLPAANARSLELPPSAARCCHVEPIPPSQLRTPKHHRPSPRANSRRHSRPAHPMARNDSGNPAETAPGTQPSVKNPTAVSAWVHRAVMHFGRAATLSLIVRNDTSGRTRENVSKPRHQLTAVLPA